MQLENEDSTTQFDTTKVENKLNFWAKELHDMSGRNRLLFYKDTKSSTATIEAPSFGETFELLVEKGGELLAPLPDPKEAKSVFDVAEEDESDKKNQNAKKPRKLKENEIQTNKTIPVLNRVLYNLRYTSRTLKEEQGFNVLYATFGMLKWKEFQNGDFNYAPLVLVPIQIERVSPASPYKISMAEDDIVVNPVLQTKLQKDFEIQLPEVSNDISLNQLQEFLSIVSGMVQEMPGWEVDESITVGTFNFLTLLLIKDFENNVDLYKQHPVVQVLSGVEDASISIPDDLPLAQELDELVDPSTIYQIMDADSSQQEAIEAAKRGLSFILQGPPGTGKSQTIANIIAEFLMAEKKVLFVSQKMAALEVVQNRLNQRELGEFCLEAHSHKMDKRKVIDDLMRSLSNTQPPSRKTNYQSNLVELKQLRNDLNIYIRQLHEPRFELNISLYQAQGQLSKVLDAPQISFNFPEIEKVKPEEFNKLLSTLREIASYSQIILTYKKNRWKGFSAPQISIQEREDNANNLQITADAISEFCQKIQEIIKLFDLPIPQSIQDHLKYLSIFETFTPAIFSDTVQGAIENYIQKYQSFTRYFNIHYWKDSSLLKNIYIKDSRPNPQDVLPTLSLVVDIKKSSNGLFDETTPNNDQPIQDIDDLQELRTKIIDGFNFAQKLFGEDDTPEPIVKKTDQLPVIAIDWFVDHSQNTDELADWANFNATRIECVESGMSDFICKALDGELQPEQWEGSFLRRFYLLLTERITSDRPVLQKFRGSLQSEMIHRFRELDVASIESASYEIRAKLYEGKPQASWIQSGTAETSILRREFNKKRRILPLRRLFQEIPNLIQSLKPCLMMSPLTVCQLLDPHIYQFDIVIFDEASQIPPEYAISAFLRANQVIVAGDRQQLPPTNFFHVVEADDFEDNEDDKDDDTSYESILNACDSSGFPNKMLNWHYRSKDESLIAYSNYHFYENRLMTFPNASSTRNESGLSFIHVKDGVYKRGAGARHNLIEAKRITELVRDHLFRTPELSLGVVAFSVSQRKAIEAELELLRKENPELNALFSYDFDEPIFVKNLENVQGDERDVIILSVGYGKDEAGKMTLNFGPINRQGGTRRLNVAVTRARYSLKLVASIEPEDIDLSRTESDGASLLRNYLEVARDGVRAIYKEEKVYADAEFDSPFEESVYYELSRRGVQLIPQVGVSQYRIDLAVVDPKQTGRFLLGIECDGAMYHSASTARDRDRLRQQVLEGLGWKIHRIWSREWLQNRAVEIEKVLDAIEISKKSINSKPLPKKKQSNRLTQQENNILPEANKIKTDFSGPQYPPSAVPYKRRRLQRQRYTGGDALLETSIYRIAEAFKAIVDAEGPISINDAKNRVVDAWMTRKGSRIDAYLDRTLYRAQTDKTIKVNGNFLWPIDMQIPPLRIYIPGGALRQIQDIAPEEIMLALLECVNGAVGINKEDLIRETCKLFGSKATQDNTRIIGNIVDHMISNRIFKSDEGKISKAKKNS